MMKRNKAQASWHGGHVDACQEKIARGLADTIVWRSIDDLQPFPRNPRRHPESQIVALMKSIKQVWTNPILIDETRTILAGHARFEAAKRLGMKEVPTVTIAGLSKGEKKTILICRQPPSRTRGLGF
jgi:hypothetical protein